MPKYIFKDSKARPTHEEAGDYQALVHAYEFGLVQNGNNAGADMLTLTLETENGVLVYENLIFTEKNAWKIDNALKCFVAKENLPQLNDEVEIDEAYVKKFMLNRTGGVSLKKVNRMKDGKIIEGQYRNEVATFMTPEQWAKASTNRPPAINGAAKDDDTKGPF